MDLVRFDPFSLLSEMDRLFERGITATPAWAPRIDAFDREKELVVRVELPGVKPEDVDITVEDRTLTISGKRQFEETVEQGNYHRREIFTGEFRRTLVLPEGLNAGEITAKAENGLLSVILPRRPEVLPRKVKVDVAS
ncbi:MAG: Hsp20/alpha crystallin family protein [Acidimicrobiia bacterium]|jgi:HSP20 family protein|nr:Hsp20/alpha crystallin family protein [Acidimicrobiia bacterium]